MGLYAIRQEQSGQDAPKQEKISGFGRIEKFELIRPKIMDYECGFRVEFEDLSNDRKESAKKRYAAFVNGVIKELEPDFRGTPKNASELEDFVKSVINKVRKKSEYPENTELDATFIFDSFDEKEIPTLDCDTTAIVAADILSYFGISSKIVSVPKHAMLKARAQNGEELYFETTKIGEEVGKSPVYKSAQEVIEAYGIINYEAAFCEFNTHSVGFVNQKLRNWHRASGGDMGWLDKAVLLLDKAIGQNPNEPYLRILKSWTFELMKNYGEAKKELQWIAENSPNFRFRMMPEHEEYNASTLLNEIGEMCYNLGQMDEALVHYAKSSELDPTYIPPRDSKAFIYSKRGLKDREFDEYTAIIEKGRCHKNETKNKYYRLRGRIYEANKKLPEALEDYNKALDGDEGNVWTRVYRMRVCFELDKPKRVIKDAEALQEICPKREKEDNLYSYVLAWALLTKGDAQRTRGDEEDANESYQDALKTVDKHIAADRDCKHKPHALKADILRRLGKIGEAEIEEKKD